MSAHGLLDQLLRSGRDLLQGGGMPGRSGSGGLGGLGNLGGLSNPGGLGKLGAGAGVAGVLGSLLGSKRGRSYGGKALKYGSIAALGLMAYKAYTAWQAQQQAQGQAPGQAQGQGRSFTPGVAASQAGAIAEPRTLDRVPPDEAEEHSRAVLMAMIAAAKADGHLDDRERDLIQQALSREEDDPQLRRWQEDLLRRPLDPAEVARAATSPEIASEMYLASLLMVDETSFMERAYLDELARQLKLPDGLKAQLEDQALAQG